jgi:hypothetical protein
MTRRAIRGAGQHASHDSTAARPAPTSDLVEVQRRTLHVLLVALVAGPIAAVNGGLVLAIATGGPGTGNGVVGGAAALVLGLIATVLGGLAVARSRIPPSVGLRRIDVALTVRRHASGSDRRATFSRLIWLHLLFGPRGTYRWRNDL